jgi:N-formylglutamate deformylase
MSLPLLISVPHAGLRVPPEVETLCILNEEEIIRDGDEGAGRIYHPLKEMVAAFVTTDIARAIVDMNRAERDRRKDGVVKTHTCWDVPVYGEKLGEGIVRTLIEKYHRPYHEKLTRFAEDVIMGVDCHTMAAQGPPVGNDFGVTRPHLCLSDYGATCPREWTFSLAACLEQAFGTKVSINHPFRGGHIIRSHAKEVPWIQLELSRGRFMSERSKSECVHMALKAWVAGLKHHLG